MTDLDETGLGHPLERLPDHGARDAEDLGQPTLAGQRVAGAERAGHDLVEDLLEDLVGDRAAPDRLEWHEAGR